jgi:hypothetical protein
MVAGWTDCCPLYRVGAGGIGKKDWAAVLYALPGTLCCILKIGEYIHGIYDMRIVLQ